MDKSIRQIMYLMEDIGGFADVSNAMGDLGSDIGMDMMPGDPAQDECEPEDQRVSPEVLDLARELVAQAGSADKAREILDKVEEVMDLLGDVVDNDTDMIAHFADSLPEEPDLPSNRHNILGMTAMVNPSQMTR